jgi:hypothetical protein
MTKMIDYHQDLLDFFNLNNIPRPNVDTLKGQALALMSQPEYRNGVKFVDRDIASEFFKGVGLKTSDSIQPFNKPLKNLKLVHTKRGYYSLMYPFEIDAFQIYKRISVDTNVLKNGTKEEQVKIVKSFWKEKTKKIFEEIDFLLQLKNKKCSSLIYEKINEAKWNIKYILEPNVEEWHIGHLDADKGNEPENLRYQPPIQARFRDKYIFNDFFERLKK